MEPSSPKKIQFAAPPLQGQLDPQAAEQVRASNPCCVLGGGWVWASHAFQKKQSTYDSPTVKGKH
uniref:Uncharacterized protein n=1 Tax=Oryzias melastigma TaxID=30732 RepID=A0A3B3DMQ9_ORYME